MCDASVQSLFLFNQYRKYAKNFSLFLYWDHLSIMSIALFFFPPCLFYIFAFGAFFTLVFYERFNSDEPVSLTDEHCLKYKSFQIQGFRLCCVIL